MHSLEHLLVDLESAFVPVHGRTRTYCAAFAIAIDDIGPVFEMIAAVIEHVQFDIFVLPLACSFGPR